MKNFDHTASNFVTMLVEPFLSGMITFAYEAYEARNTKNALPAKRTLAEVEIISFIDKEIKRLAKHYDRIG